jgi:hypothetical protein
LWCGPHSLKTQINGEIVVATSTVVFFDVSVFVMS